IDSGPRTVRLASIDPPALGDPPDSPFGFNHSFAWDFLIRLSKLAGVVWWRDWSAKWQTVEPREGAFDFSATDRMGDRLRALGGRIDSLIPYPSSSWSSSAAADLLLQAQRPDFPGLSLGGQPPAPEASPSPASPSAAPAVSPASPEAGREAQA